MHAFKIVLILISLSSCLSKDNAFLKFKGELKKGSSINFNDRYLNKGLIKKPLNSLVEIVKTKDSCLLYKTPYAKRKSPIYIASAKNGRCIQKDMKIAFKDVKSFRVKLIKSVDSKDNGILKLFIDGETIRVPLINLSYKRNFKQFDHQLDGSFIEGLSLYRPRQVKILKDGVSCHAVNSDCLDVVKNECDKCQNGFYEVVDYNCKQGGTKYCGKVECGQKNQPACLRGYLSLDSKMRSLCFEGSPAGFCKPGLRTSCNSNNILICI